MFIIINIITVIGWVLIYICQWYIRVNLITYIIIIFQYTKKTSIFDNEWISIIIIIYKSKSYRYHIIFIQINFFIIYNSFFFSLFITFIKIKYFFLNNIFSNNTYFYHTC